MTGVLRGHDVHALLGRKVPELARKYLVPGVQLATRYCGRTEVVQVGEREHETGNPVTRGTAFPIGSITKSFTATAAMVLVADGDLDLDAPIRSYLRDLDDACRTITLRQLLSHTSGLGSGAIPGSQPTGSLRRYVADRCRGGNMVLRPGIGFSYSNTGFVVVGHLIETITGMGFWEALESVLLRPMGIEPGFINDPRPEPARRALANGYSVNVSLNRTRPVAQSLAPAEAPAGGLAVSAEDLVALGSMLLGGGPAALLPSSCAEQMRQPVPGVDPFGLAGGWGLGLAVYAAGDTAWLGHDGNSNGTSCYLRFNPALDLVIAFTSNANTGLGVWQELLADLADAGIPVEEPLIRASSPAPASSLPACAGVYTNGDVTYLVRADADGQLQLAVDGAVFARLTCQSDLTFALHIPTSGQQLFCGRFLPDPDTGAIDRIQVSGRLARRAGDPAGGIGQPDPEAARSGGRGRVT